MSRGLFEWSLCYDQAPPAEQLLAFAFRLSSHDLERGWLIVEIPREVFEAVQANAFRALFSDVLLDACPTLEPRLQVQVVSGTTFRARLVEGATR